MKFSVVLPAAGSGRRMGEGKNKVLLPLAGKPLLKWTLEPFLGFEGMLELIVVGRSEDFPLLEPIIARDPRIRLVQGGKERFDSVRLGLEKGSDQAEWVVIHDAARPLVTPQIIGAVLEMAEKTGAAAAALPMWDSVKRADASGVVLESVPREGLWRAQTPQVFRRQPFLECLRKARDSGASYSDEAMVAEAFGMPVTLVPGSETNIKITTPDQLEFAARWLAS